MDGCFQNLKKGFIIVWDGQSSKTSRQEVENIFLRTSLQISDHIPLQGFQGYHKVNRDVFAIFSLDAINP